jgi:hypothetical protein
MQTRIPGIIYITVIITLMIIGCSHSNSPVITQLDSDSSPLSIFSDSSNLTGGVGIIGAYELTVNPSSLKAELTPKRVSSIGESFVVNGKAFFTDTPCATCFNIAGLQWHQDGITVLFSVEHPLPAGDPGQPPSAANRLDLDVFDLAAVLRPIDISPTVFPKNFKKIYTGIVKNQDGFTGELESLTAEDEVLPYVLLIDESESGTSTWNRFAMGTSHLLALDFYNFAETMRCEIFLTMGYGASATLLNRLTPKYYNPEFNRHAPWKVDAKPDGLWNEGDSTSSTNVEVRVYDWQIGATVATAPNFRDADPSEVFAASEIESVSVEIMGMSPDIASVDGDSFIAGTGMPGNPLIYMVPVRNQNLLTAGQYHGLVKVLDERPVLTTSDSRDILIDTDDGYTLEKYVMPEYATYQIFNASVIEECTGYCWGHSWGANDYDNVSSVAVDDQGFVYAVGTFYSVVEFDPEGYGRMTSRGSSDPYMSKFDSNGNWIWTKTWGGRASDEANCIKLDSNGNIFVAGNFNYTAEFNPIGGTLITSGHDFDDVYLTKFDSDGYWLWTHTWGGDGIDDVFDIDVNRDGYVYAVGQFRGSVDFKPGGGDIHASHGDYDAYLTKFSPDGDWQIAEHWGGPNEDTAYGVMCDYNNMVTVTGLYRETVAFNPSGGSEHTANGVSDCFISRFNANDEWQWAKVWGGDFFDFARDVECDSSNNIYVTGSFSDTVNFNPVGGGSKTSHGSWDVWLSRFAPDGTWQWTEIWGANELDTGMTVHVDRFDSIFVGGYFAGSCEFNPDGGGSQTATGMEDAFTSKLDTDGNWVWSKTWGGSEQDMTRSISTDLNGNVYNAGSFRVVSNLAPGGGDNHTSNGQTDAFLTKFNY